MQMDKSITRPSPVAPTPKGMGRENFCRDWEGLPREDWSPHPSSVQGRSGRGTVTPGRALRALPGDRGDWAQVGPHGLGGHFQPRSSLVLPCCDHSMGDSGDLFKRTSSILQQLNMFIFLAWKPALPTTPQGRVLGGTREISIQEVITGMFLTTSCLRAAIVNQNWWQSWCLWSAQAGIVFSLCPVIWETQNHFTN